MSIEQDVISHYHAGAPDVAARIIAFAGGAAGLTADKLAPYDEMHVGGHPATLHLLAGLGLRPGMRVLDIGCGIGGAARTAALCSGAHVTGLDLTPGYVAAATLLSELTGLGDSTSFETGNATAMNFADAAFDAAYTIHAAMNIADKAALYHEAARVLKDHALFGVYDVMAEPGADMGDLRFPLPWADSAATSFLATAQETTAMLEEAGFAVVAAESRRDAALAALHRMMAKGPQLKSALHGDDFPLRLGHLLHAVEQGKCSPAQIIVRKK